MASDVFCIFTTAPMGTTEQHIKKLIKDSVASMDTSAIAILYGSRARGDAKPDSDWDILILLNQPKVSFKEEQKFRHKLYDIELQTGQTFSTFVYSLEDWNSKLAVTPLHKSVEKDGLVL